MSPLRGIAARRTWALGASVLVMGSLIAAAVIAGGHSSPASMGPVAAGTAGPTASWGSWRLH